MATETFTPEEAIERLKAGNQRFVGNKRLTQDLLVQVKGTAGGQHPFAAIVGCIDSRAVPELIFDQGIGDLFSVRIAGNVIDEDVLGSLEFSCVVAGVRLIVVKGHTRCGAVAGACTGAGEGHLRQLLDKINPAIEKTKELQKNLSDIEFRDEVSRINALNSVALIKEKSPALRDLSEKGQIAIIAALYDVSTGVVTFYDQE